MSNRVVGMLRSAVKLFKINMVWNNILAQVHWNKLDPQAATITPITKFKRI